MVQFFSGGKESMHMSIFVLETFLSYKEIHIINTDILLPFYSQKELHELKDVIQNLDISCNNHNI